MDYRVSEIFPTIQGEGAYTGTPMVLVRLQGCDLRCNWCDTAHAQDVRGGQKMTEQQILEEVVHCAGPKWVLLTGGEPTLQDLEPLCQLLASNDYQIALETNGNGGFNCDLFEWVCVSPKLDEQSGTYRLTDSSWSGADELKFVIGSQADLDLVDRVVVPYLARDRAWLAPAISLQPQSLDPAATKLCFETCLARNWRLSIQVHKYIGVR